MQLLIVENDPAYKATLHGKVVEGLRQADIRSFEVLGCRPDDLAGLPWGTVTGAILGPGCFADLENIFEKIKKQFATGPIGVTLSTAEYEQHAVALTKKLGSRVFNIEDSSQLAQFLVECEQYSSAALSRKNKNVIGVAHFKGGVGATTLAVSLASCWARSGCKVALVDLDDVNPHITSWARVGISKRAAVGEHLTLGHVPESRVPDIASPVESFGGNLAVVGQPENYNEGFHFKANVIDTAPSASEFIHSLISALKASYEIVVIDMARSWGLASFACLPRCEKVLLVTDEDQSSAKRTLDCLHRLKRESDDSDEFDLSRWSIVLNGYTGSLLSPQQLSKLVEDSTLFTDQHKLIVTPYSASGRLWGEPGRSFYDLADPKTQSALRSIAYDLVTFRMSQEPSKKGESVLQRFLPW